MDPDHASARSDSETTLPVRVTRTRAYCLRWTRSASTMDPDWVAHPLRSVTKGEDLSTMNPV